LVETPTREAYKLAITMLAELERSTDLCDACALDEFVRGRGRPQYNIVLRYLEQCRASSPASEAAFCAVLSDLVAMIALGVVPDSGSYERALKIPMPVRRLSEAAKRRRAWRVVQHVTGRNDPMPADFGKGAARG